MAALGIPTTRALAAVTTCCIRCSASSLLVSYSSAWIRCPLVELLRATPQKVTTAPQSGRVAHDASCSADKGASDTAIQSWRSSGFTALTL